MKGIPICIDYLLYRDFFVIPDILGKKRNA